MSITLPRDAVLEKAAGLPARCPSTALVRVLPYPLQRAANDDAACRRLDVLRMSGAERHAAVAALLLGRDIGGVLIYLGGVVRRLLSAYTGYPNLRRASFRNRMRMRRAPLYRPALPARLPARLPASRLK